VDGTTLDVADTPANAAAFGRPATHRGERATSRRSAWVAVAECGTHAIIQATMGPLAKGETTLAAELFGPGGVLGQGVLLLADRQFVDANLWRQAATGAQLLWRTRTNAVLPVLETFNDGSYLSQIAAASDRRQGIAPTLVRVVEYTLGKDSGRPGQAAPIRLLTTILDPTQAPAAELAALYHQRWEFETTLDELKTHQRGPKVVLRPRSPEMVAQEVWGHAAGPPRHPRADAPGRPGPSGGPRPGLLHPQLAGRAPPGHHHRPGGPSPLSPRPGRWSGPGGRSPSGCCPHADCAPSPVSSSARCRTSASSAPSTAPGRSRRCLLARPS
jgi:hypothetical protein